jgi:hypothetical protein
MLFFLFNPNRVNAQEKDDSRNVTSVTKITFLEPGVAQELALGKSITVMFRAGITATLAVDEYEEEITGLLPRIFGGTSLRTYYNFKKRNEEEKNTNNNSANYISLLGMYSTKPLSKRTDYDQDFNNPLLNLGIVWGMQRNYPSGFSLDLNIGPGYASAGKAISSFTVVGEFTLGWRLGKKD